MVPHPSPQQEAMQGLSVPEPWTPQPLTLAPQTIKREKVSGTTCTTIRHMDEL